MTITNWDEIRTAFQVARVGTVSGAADVLGVHHATVIRHVDALEERLSTKLFQRHARGYTPTDAGKELLNVAQATDDQFSQLAARLGGQSAALSGELIITSVAGLSKLVTYTMVRLKKEHPELILRYETGTRLFRLEYGEAHVAIRAGTRPAEPDNVVQALPDHRMALFASKDYVAQYGQIVEPEGFAKHLFIGDAPLEARAPFNRWLLAHITPEQIVYRSNEPEARLEALEAGVGIGFLPVLAGADSAHLVEMMPSNPEWTTNLWLVTHVDLHRSAKVQLFVNALKADLRERCLG